MTSLRAAGFDTAAVGALVTKVFGEMIFSHGFVHCDPHPGEANFSIRQSKSSFIHPKAVARLHRTTIGPKAYATVGF